MAATESAKIEFFPYFNLFVQVSYFLMYSRHLLLCMVYSDIIFKPGIHLGIQNGCQYCNGLIEMSRIETSEIITFVMFLPINQLLRQIEIRYWCLYLCIGDEESIRTIYNIV